MEVDFLASTAERCVGCRVGRWPTTFPQRLPYSHRPQIASATWYCQVTPNPTNQDVCDSGPVLAVAHRWLPSHAKDLESWERRKLSRIASGLVLDMCGSSDAVQAIGSEDMLSQLLMNHYSFFASRNHKLHRWPHGRLASRKPGPIVWLTMSCTV